MTARWTRTPSAWTRSFATAGRSRPLPRDSGLVYLYTLVSKDGHFYFSAPTVTEEEAEERERWYFYPYADAPPMLEKALRTGLVQYSSYSDQWGTFRSVAVPEVSPGGVPYLACADMDISGHQRQAS